MWPASRIDVAAAGIAGAGLLAYVNALGGSFQFDDWNVIVADQRVQSLAAWLRSMPGIRPVLKLSYALNHEAGFGIVGFHALNIIVHLANGLLVLALLRRWGGGSAGAGAALLAALIFVLHPVQTEAVTYVSGRSTSLCAFFLLASLNTWVLGRERGGSWLSDLLSPALFALALATRESAAVLPLALLLWRWTAGPSPADKASALRATAMHWAVLITMTGAALAMADYQRFFAASLGARPLLAQVLTQADAVTYLAGQLVRPDQLNADPMLPVRTVLTPGIGLRALVLVLLVLAGVAGIRRRPAVAFGLLWFFLWLAPTNSLLPRFDVANDRQLYLALVGPAWLAGLAIGVLARRHFRVAAGVGVLLALGLGTATVQRNAVYADEVVFWRDVVTRTPGNARAHANLGYAYALARRDRDAAREFRQALAIDPGHVRAAANLALLRRGLLLPESSATDTAAGSRRTASP